MESARLKVKRAERHIDEFISDQDILPSRIYDLGVTCRSVALLREPDCNRVTYFPKQSVTKHFGAIAGDAVNNLRESLELWMNAAALCVGPAKKLYFPFSKERKNLETSQSFASVKKAFPDAATFIAKKIEPCWDRNLHLWAATSLCNQNKHNDFIPVVTLGEIKGKNIKFGNISVSSLKVSGDANKPQTLYSGPLGSITEENNFEVSVEVSFPKGAIFEHQPVVPTLLNMAQVVSQTLDALEVFITPYCR